VGRVAELGLLGRFDYDHFPDIAKLEMGFHRFGDAAGGQFHSMRFDCATLRMARTICIACFHSSSRGDGPSCLAVSSCCEPILFTLSARCCSRWSGHRAVRPGIFHCDIHMKQPNHALRRTRHDSAGRPFSNSRSPFDLPRSGQQDDSPGENLFAMINLLPLRSGSARFRIGFPTLKAAPKYPRHCWYKPASCQAG